MSDAIESMDELAEAGMAEVLDSDDFGTLYSVSVLDATISVYEADDIYVNTDWQGPQPQSCEEMAGFEWLPIDAFCEVQ